MQRISIFFSSAQNKYFNIFYFFFYFQPDLNSRTLKLAGHVGFDSLPDQLVNKSVQNGFVFNIMCIGKENHIFMKNAQHKSRLWWRSNGFSQFGNCIFSLFLSRTQVKLVWENRHWWILYSIRVSNQHQALTPYRMSSLSHTHTNCKRAAYVSSWRFAIPLVMAIKSTKMIHLKRWSTTSMHNSNHICKKNWKLNALYPAVMIAALMCACILSVQPVTVWNHWIWCAWRSWTPKSISYQSSQKLTRFRRPNSNDSNRKSFKSSHPMVFISINFPPTMNPFPRWIHRWTAMFHSPLLVAPILFGWAIKRYGHVNILGAPYKVRIIAESFIKVVYWFWIEHRFDYFSPSKLHFLCTFGFHWIEMFQLKMKTIATSWSFAKCWFERIWKICERKPIPDTMNCIVKSA